MPRQSIHSILAIVVVAILGVVSTSSLACGRGPERPVADGGGEEGRAVGDAKAAGGTGGPAGLDGTDVGGVAVDEAEIVRRARQARYRLQVLRDGSAAEREEAVDVLGGLGAVALPGLTGLLDHEDPSVRRLAVRALGGIGSAAIPALVKARLDPEAAVRGEAVASLARIGQPAIPTLIALALDSEPVQSREARRALLALGQEGRQSVVVLLQAPDALVARDTAEVLGLLGIEAAVPALEEALDHPSERVREAAAEALDRIRGGADVP